MPCRCGKATESSNPTNQTVRAGLAASRSRVVVDARQHSKGDATDEAFGAREDGDPGKARERRDPEDDAELRRLARDEQNSPDEDHDNREAAISGVPFVVVIGQT